MAAVVAKREGPPFTSEAAVRGNAAVLDYCRTSVSALSGATAGILGLTGLYGFIFYLLASTHTFKQLTQGRNTPQHLLIWPIRCHGPAALI